MTRSTSCASATWRSGQDLADVVPRSAIGGAWSSDSAYFFYTVHDDMWRQHQIWRHRMGTPASEDGLVLEEPDEQFELDAATRPGPASWW